MADKGSLKAIGFLVFITFSSKNNVHAKKTRREFVPQGECKLFRGSEGVLWRAGDQ